MKINIWARDARKMEGKLPMKMCGSLSCMKEMKRRESAGNFQHKVMRDKFLRSFSQVRIVKLWNANI